MKSRHILDNEMKYDYFAFYQIDIVGTSNSVFN